MKSKREYYSTKKPKSRRTLKGGRKSSSLKKHSSRNSKRTPTITREQGERELQLERLEIILPVLRQKHKDLQRKLRNTQIEKDELISQFDTHLKGAEVLITKIQSSQTNETERAELVSTFKSKYGNLQKLNKEQNDKLLVFVNKQKQLEEEITRVKDELQSTIEKIGIIVAQSENA
jgi:hypothetical protein